ncbi:Ig-like domain-containing protein [Pantoea sp. SOD02]|uniref:Ig-like domain-containing protein n=1 Tax=Pantoea sp. SOD02 TaxID=2970818 RepID=UPI002157DCAC|nr:Ig-like domain-containing protein [Pantoea sp. SOD02]UVC27967.1 Ig-like domain-containing protein [Pantoea sp. SOD02]
MTHQDINDIIYAESDSPFPTFTGSAPEEIGKPGTFARLTIGTNYYEVPVDPLTGLYTWTATRPLPDGDYSVAVSIRDNAGNVGQPSLYTLRIDTTPPEAPMLIKLYDDFGSEQHAFEPGDKTDDKRPTLTGIAQRGTTVFLLDDQGERIGSAVADSVTGLWQMDPEQDLVEGSNSLRLIAEEVFAGKTRTGTPSAPFTIIIESSTLPPDTVTLTHAIDDAGSATGELSNGALTDDTRPELRGTVSLGSTVTVFYRLAGSNLWLGSAKASVSGENWSWTPGQALPAGHYEFQASIGNAASALFALDIASPADIIARTRIDYVIDDMGASRGQLGNGALTDDTTPTFVGSGEANSKVVIRLTRNAGLSATVVVDVDSAGNWSWTPAPPLTAGHWSFQLQVAGHSDWSAPFTLDVSTDANYLGAIIEYAVDNVGPVTDILRNGSTTDDTTPTLQGRAEANSTVLLRYSVAGQSATVLSLKADNNGHWSWTPPALANGSWNFEVYNAALNRWSSFKLNIDTDVDRLPTFDYAIDNVGPVKETLYSGATTDDTTPLLVGSGAPNTDITIRTKHNDGPWSYRNSNTSYTGQWGINPVNLQKGTWTFEVQKVGGNSWSSFVLIIDPTVDRTPLIEYAADNVGPITDNLSSGATTDDTTPTLHGTAAANTIISLRYKSGSGSWSTTNITVDDNGNWTWTPAALAKGTWTFEVQKQGQGGWASFSLNIDPLPGVPVIVDFLDNVGSWMGPVLPDGSKASTDDNTPTLRGTGTANSIIYIQSAKEGDSWGDLGSVRADANGNWSYTPAALEIALWQFRVKAGNANGESAWATKVYLNIVDLEALRIPVIDYVQDNVGPVTDNISNGGKTDDRTPTLHGTGTAGSLVTVIYSRSESGQFFFFGSAVVGTDGRWSWTTPSLIDNGNWYFRAFATRDSEESGRSGSFVIDIDPTVDRTPIIDYAVDNVGPVRDDLRSGGSTDDRTPELHGTGPASSEVSLRVSGSAGSTIYVVKTDAAGNWSWTPPAALSEGGWNFQVSSKSVPGYGQPFALTIVSPTYSGIIDFEEGTPVGKRFSWGGLIAKAYEYDNLTFNTYGANSDLKFVSTDFIGDADFGLKALTMLYADYIQLVPKQDAHFSRYLKDFSFTFYNDQPIDFRMSFNINLRTDEGRSKKIAFTISFKPGITVFTANDLPEGSKLSPGDVIENMDLHRKYSPSGITHNLPIYIDNISWVTKADSGKTSLFALEDDSIHSIAGIDSVFEANIIGKEIQPDTLQLTDQNQLLDLTSANHHIQSIEIFDITGSGNNTLKLDLNALLEHGEKDLFIEDGKTQLMVKGNEGDVVQLKDILPQGSDISEWKHQDGTVKVAGVEYEVYRHGDDAELLVQQGVKTELI